MQRNRILQNGDQWLSPEMESFMSTRLKESNAQLKPKERILEDIKSVYIREDIKKILGSERVTNVKKYYREVKERISRFFQIWGQLGFL